MSALRFIEKWFGGSGSGGGSGDSSQEPAPAPAPKPQPQENKPTQFHIFTDGACSDNGRRGAKAGIGVYYYSLPTAQHLSRPLSKHEPHTNNRAELTALLEAFRWLEKNPRPEEVCIWSDSEYSIHAITKWAAGWKRNGWRKKDGRPIQNLDLIQTLYEKLSMNPKVHLRHVDGHNKSRASEFPWCGNHKADELARQGVLHSE